MSTIPANLIELKLRNIMNLIENTYLDPHFQLSFGTLYSACFDLTLENLEYDFVVTLIQSLAKVFAVIRNFLIKPEKTINNKIDINIKNNDSNDISSTNKSEEPCLSLNDENNKNVSRNPVNINPNNSINLINSINSRSFLYNKENQNKLDFDSTNYYKQENSMLNIKEKKVNNIINNNSKPDKLDKQDKDEINNNNIPNTAATTSVTTNTNNVCNSKSYKSKSDLKNSSKMSNLNVISNTNTINSHLLNISQHQQTLLQASPQFCKQSKSPQMQQTKNKTNTDTENINLLKMSYMNNSPIPSHTQIKTQTPNQTQPKSIVLADKPKYRSISIDDFQAILEHYSSATYKIEKALSYIEKQVIKKFNYKENDYESNNESDFNGTDNKVFSFKTLIDVIFFTEVVSCFFTKSNIRKLVLIIEDFRINEKLKFHYLQLLFYLNQTTLFIKKQEKNSILEFIISKRYYSVIESLNNEVLRKIERRKKKKGDYYCSFNYIDIIDISKRVDLVKNIKEAFAMISRNYKVLFEYFMKEIEGSTEKFYSGLVKLGNNSSKDNNDNNDNTIVSSISNNKLLYALKQIYRFCDMEETVFCYFSNYKNIMSILNNNILGNNLTFFMDYLFSQLNEFEILVCRKAYSRVSKESLNDEKELQNQVLYSDILSENIMISIIEEINSNFNNNNNSNTKLSTFSTFTPYIIYSLYFKDSNIKSRFDLLFKEKLNKHISDVEELYNNLVNKDLNSLGKYINNKSENESLNTYNNSRSIMQHTVLYSYTKEFIKYFYNKKLIVQAYIENYLTKENIISNSSNGTTNAISINKTSIDVNSINNINNTVPSIPTISNIKSINQLKDNKIEQIFKGCFERILNTYQSNTFIEIFNVYINEEILSSVNKSSVSSIIKMQAYYNTMFKSLHNKDVFEKHYRELLSKRLLKNNSLIREVEIFLFENLLRETGKAFLKKICTMLQDIVGSNQMNIEFGFKMRSMRNDNDINKDNKGNKGRLNMNNSIDKIITDKADKKSELIYKIDPDITFDDKLNNYSSNNNNNTITNNTNNNVNSNANNSQYKTNIHIKILDSESWPINYSQFENFYSETSHSNLANKLIIHNNINNNKDNNNNEQEQTSSLEALTISDFNLNSYSNFLYSNNLSFKTNSYIENYYTCFSDYFSSKNKGKKLVFINELSWGEISATYNCNRKYSFICSGIQMSVILLLNEDIKTSYSLSDIIKSLIQPLKHTESEISVILKSKKNSVNSKYEATKAKSTCKSVDKDYFNPDDKNEKKDDDSNIIKINPSVISKIKKLFFIEILPLIANKVILINDSPNTTTNTGKNNADRFLSFNNIDDLEFTINNNFNTTNKCDSINSQEYRINFVNMRTNIFNRLIESHINFNNSKNNENNNNTQITTKPKDTCPLIIEDRKYRIDAFIMKIIKAVKLIDFNSLTLQIISKISNSFIPDTSLLKTRLENLIERNLIIRDEENNDMFKYNA